MMPDNSMPRQNKYHITNALNWLIRGFTSRGLACASFANGEHDLQCTLTTLCGSIMVFCWMSVEYGLPKNNHRSLDVSHTHTR